VFPLGKRLYPRKYHHLKRLELYREERERQERLGKDKRKSGQVTGGGVPYAPRNIFNVLPSQTAAQEPDSPVAKAAIEGLGTVPIGHGSDFVPP
jgi:hypothetical protein